MSNESPSLLDTVRNAQKAADQRVQTACGSAGLTLAQYQVLDILCAGPQVALADLGRRLGITPQSVYALANRMEAAGLVVRADHPDRPRIILVRPSAAGVDRRAQAKSAIDDIAQRMASSLTPTEAMSLRVLLERWTRDGAPVEDQTAVSGVCDTDRSAETLWQVGRRLLARPRVRR